MFSNSDPVLYKDITSPIKQSLFLFSSILTNLHQYKCFSGQTQQIVQSVCLRFSYPRWIWKLAEQDAMTHVIILLFAQTRVGFCHFQLRRPSTEAVTARISPAEQGALHFFLSRLTLPFPSPDITNRAHVQCNTGLKQFRESSKKNLHVGVMNFHPAADNQQPGGGRSRKELADVGPGKLLLLFSCSAVPDGQSHPACCILVYHSRHCLAVQEGGRWECQGQQVVRLCTGQLCC